MGSLRQLDSEQQVALLFVILFGLLLVVSALGAVRLLRERAGQDYARARRWRGELRALWIGAVVFWLAWVSGSVGATVLFGVVSFLALREYITLLRTRAGDHRSLLLAFFVVLPVQYALVGSRSFDLFSVFIPVYMFLAIPVVSALAGDPERFLERNAKIQWGVMVCVYGLSHAPALLLLDFPRLQGRGAFLLFFLVVVVVCGQIGQALARHWVRALPVARQIDRGFSYRAFGAGLLVAGLVGAAMYWVTPFKPGQALAMALIAAGAGALGEFVMSALKKDAGVSHWGNAVAITGAVGLLDRLAPLCFAAPVFFHSVRWYFQLRA